MTDKYIRGGEAIKEQIAAAIVRLKELGATGSPALFMRQNIFRALAGSVKMDTDPPCLIIQDEPIPVIFDEPIVEERGEAEGTTEYTSDIWIRFIMEGQNE